MMKTRFVNILCADECVLTACAYRNTIVRSSDFQLYVYIGINVIRIAHYHNIFYNYIFIRKSIHLNVLLNYSFPGLCQEQKQHVEFKCPEEFGYYPHPNDCSQYYVCVFGGALLESCTGGLMYR